MDDEFGRQQVDRLARYIIFFIIGLILAGILAFMSTRRTPPDESTAVTLQSHFTEVIEWCATNVIVDCFDNCGTGTPYQPSYDECNMYYREEIYRHSTATARAVQTATPPQ